MDVGKVMREVIELLSPPENVTIASKIPMPTIIAEPTRIQQIFQNLLSNAIKYTDKPRSKISIACTMRAITGSSASPIMGLALSHAISKEFFNYFRRSPHVTG